MIAAPAHRLAVYTFGLFRAPADDPVNDGFHAYNDALFALADQADGFIARSGYDGEPGPASWGPQVYPRFYVERGDGWSPATLSLWRDIRSLRAYTYSGEHAAAMRRGRTWFREPQWPPYALYWVAADRLPSWSEAVERHEHLHDHGPGPTAFDFRRPFDPCGNPLRARAGEVATGREAEL